MFSFLLTSWKSCKDCWYFYVWKINKIKINLWLAGMHKLVARATYCTYSSHQQPFILMHANQLSILLISVPVVASKAWSLSLLLLPSVCGIIHFLQAKRHSIAKIHCQFCLVYGTRISDSTVRDCRKFREGHTNVHN